MIPGSIFNAIPLSLLVSFTFLSYSSGSPPCSPTHQGNARQFWIENDRFCKDGVPFQIIGGDMHYFRIVPEYWKDRLLRAKALGLNTIQTYVPWNIHEPQPEKYSFNGIADLEAYIQLAHELGFLIMLRAGPYICGEWDLGGFPAWLLSIEPALELRSSDSTYLSLVERWWGVLLPKIRPLLYQNGGPIIMIQVENEYGSFGSDKNYLQYLAKLARRHLGDELVLYTTDGAGDATLTNGAIPEEGVYAAVDFDTWSNSSSAFEIQKKYNFPRKSPPLSSEFYTGWLTHWGEKLATTNASSTAAALENILSKDGSAVLYMAHGGTNFGLFSGANTDSNDESAYNPDLTSYDYDAPIKEYGDVNNPKYKELRRVIRKYAAAPLPSFPSSIATEAYGIVKLNKMFSLFEALYLFSNPTKTVESENPIPMESAGQMYGFMLYESEYEQKKGNSTVSISKIHDRAQVFVSCSEGDKSNPRFVGVIERWNNKDPLSVPYLGCPSNITLFILVENMGRVNYGKYIYDRKGILSTVQVDNLTLGRWKMHPIQFDYISNLSKNGLMKKYPYPIEEKISLRRGFKNHIGNMRYRHREQKSNTPALYKGHFNINSTSMLKDTFISFCGWNKGIAFVNNFNIGRFWPKVGPQCTLYVPAPILQQGENTLVIFELESAKPDHTINFVSAPDFSCNLNMLHEK
ncbi:Beta-galactosidase [Rhynchospora pubera]|uniref:Beta-galactosidase n=1 Tax=Rhynchospora pubera TaxID=906938 RepID=A0AAV8GMS2_9POAL|nr:Beta-galactosidase [Rhynchospora pubera]